MLNNSPEVLLIGSIHSSGTLELEEWLTRNRRSFVYVDFDNDHLKVPAGVAVDMLPVAICRDTIVTRPTVEALAKLLNLSTTPIQAVDVAIVGAGPAGLAAAIYAASEGLNTLVLEGYAPGGQAGMSSRIENYMGFPDGITGMELASTAVDQAIKFGARFAVAAKVNSLRNYDKLYNLLLTSGEVVNAKTVVIAAGAKYNQLDVAKSYEGLGVYYSATPLEAALIDSQAEIGIVGGGNSAGQAAMFLASRVKAVHILVRGKGLTDTMSQYLHARIAATPNIHLHQFTQVDSLQGSVHLESVTIHLMTVDKLDILPINHLFIMTGAKPNTDWLANVVAIDGGGWVLTGSDLSRIHLRQWLLERNPYQFETNKQGVFAVGDIRAGSVKRVASAAGEGGACIQDLHKVLQELS